MTADHAAPTPAVGRAELTQALAKVLDDEGWCCDPYGHEDGPPAPGECGECDRLRNSTAAALAAVVGERERAVKEALLAAADAILRQPCLRGHTRCHEADAILLRARAEGGEDCA